MSTSKEPPRKKTSKGNGTIGSKEPSKTSKEMRSKETRSPSMSQEVKTTASKSITRGSSVATTKKLKSQHAPLSSSKGSTNEASTMKTQRTTPKSSSGIKKIARSNSSASLSTLFNKKIAIKEDSEEKNQKRGSKDVAYIETAKKHKLELAAQIHKGTANAVWKASIYDPASKRNFSCIVKTGTVDNTSGNAMVNELRFMMTVQQFQKDQRRGTEHLLAYFDGGRFKNTVFVAYPVAGPNLNELRTILGAEFSTTTAVRLGYQATCAVECLHDMGVVHGRLDPTHFVIGSGREQCLLYLISMGKISSKSEERDWSRDGRYSPREHQEKKRKHQDKELECLILTILDIFCRKNLPWYERQCSDEEIKNWKSILFYEPENLQVPVDVQRMVRLIVNNGTIYDLKCRFIQLRESLKVHMDSLYEWEINETYKKVTAKVDEADYAIQFAKKVALVKEATRKLIAAAGLTVANGEEIATAT